MNQIKGEMEEMITCLKAAELIIDRIVELREVGIWLLPITRDESGKIYHPDTYADFKDRPNIAKQTKLLSNMPHTNGCAAITGHNGLCCIDFDLKNTVEKDLFNKWIYFVAPHVKERLYIETTRSGGYHVFFFCHSFQFDSAPAREVDGRVTIEFFCKANKIIYTFPTPGYTEHNISLYDTGLLTASEATELLECASLFNKYKGKEYAKPASSAGKKLEYPALYKSLFQHFDRFADPYKLVHWFADKTKWTVKYNNRREEYILTHPQSETGTRSAVYFGKTNILICFSTSQRLLPSFSDYDAVTNPVPYIITPTHLLYILSGSDFKRTARSLNLFCPSLSIPIKHKRWLLQYIEKSYLKEKIHLLGQRRIAGKSDFTIKVSSTLLVFLMACIDSEYTWVCDASYDEELDNEACKDVIPYGAKVGSAFGHTLWIDNKFGYPKTWDE